ncbi:MAG: fused MFS/spermidine synthase, partial [Vicinamibacterales bacterium]
MRSSKVPVVGPKVPLSGPKAPAFHTASILALFFLSGISGLIYQVLWLRRLSIIFGVTVYAASTVLAAFMAGLAIGGLLANRLLRRPRLRPLAAFGVAELLVGLTALASPWLLDGMLRIYLAFHSAETSSFAVQTYSRFLYASAVLLLPTAMMGLTLPLLAAATTASGRDAGPRVSWLYAVNTGGAVVGAIAGLSLIPAVGIRVSFLVAASLNFLVGGTALWLSSRAARSQPAQSERPASTREPVASTARLPAIWAFVIVSGFASLGLEVVWFRLMLQFVTTTTHAFTAMLATVLAGLAIGGLLAAWILARDRDWFGWLASSQAAGGVAAVLSLNALMWTHAHGWRTTGIWHVAILAILPAALLMGIGFPLAIGIAIQRRGDSSGIADDNEGAADQPPLKRRPSADQPSLKLRRSAGALAQAEASAKADGSRIGKLYAGNMAGAIAGSLVTGFVLLPVLGSTASLIALSALYVSTGVWLMWLARRRLVTSAALVVAIATL